jgi:hypothetical protein
MKSQEVAASTELLQCSKDVPQTVTSEEYSLATLVCYVKSFVFGKKIKRKNELSIFVLNAKYTRLDTAYLHKL